MNTIPAFKEWRAIVEAMGHGAQSIILRKGGISEEGGEFKPKYERFLLLPTEFHQQLSQSKPEAKRYFDFGSSLIQQVEIKYWAQATSVRFVEEWKQIQQLDSQHLLQESLLQERFEYGDRKGLYVMEVAVFRFSNPVVLPWLSSYDGCKSWVDVEAAFDFESSVPVV